MKWNQNHFPFSIPEDKNYFAYKLSKLDQNLFISLVYICESVEIMFQPEICHHLDNLFDLKQVIDS